MKILFLNHCGKLGGAELSLIDTAKPYRDNCLVGLFVDDGPLRHSLEQEHIPVRVLASQPIGVNKDSNLAQGLGSLGRLLPLIAKVARLSLEYDLIYANTHKALVVGALASIFSRRPVVYRLHDILSPDHFSQTNRRIAVAIANHFASSVIANSKASQIAFVEAGGRSELTSVVYNGFDPKPYRSYESSIPLVRKQLGLDGQFLIGHFSRLSAWKGQHVLLTALAHCPKNVSVIFVGDALFGEQKYVRALHEQISTLGLQERVQFLGFRTDVIPLMAACDLIAHTAIAPEPFGRVIVEAMLCGKPVVAAQAGGAIEIIKPGETGWLSTPGDAQQLAEIITECHNQPAQAATIAAQAQIQANQRFHIAGINQQITQLLSQIRSSKDINRQELYANTTHFE